jgi:hypothetical protein
VLPVNPDTVDVVAEDIPDVTVLIPEPTGVPEHVPPLATQNVSIWSTVDPLTAVHANANETPPAEAVTLGAAEAVGADEHVGVETGATVGVGFGVGLGVGLGVGFGVGLGDGLATGDGLVDGLGVGLATGDSTYPIGSGSLSPFLPITENV